MAIDTGSYEGDTLNPTEIIRNFRWSDLSQSSPWESWRAAKIRVLQDLASAPPVTLESLSAPAPKAIAELKRRCALGNAAQYRVANAPCTTDEASAALAQFARQMGLFIREDHRSAGRAGVVALQTSSEEGKAGYIPYTDKPLNWHTDGYYNDPEHPVMGFVLHCHCPAAAGGENQLLDPEIAYMRLRDENPDYIKALMHPKAMTIPENQELDGSVRPASIGPVFFAHAATGRLQMRYTARTRSIAWRDDPLTRQAADRLREILMAGDPLMQQVRLQAGEGILNNNVLHNRTRFTDGAASRVMLRLRFHDRVAED